MQRLLFASGALLGLTAVAMASAAAHAFNALPPDRLQIIRVALQIHGWHALAVLACALWLPRGGVWTVAGGWLFVVGLLVFCAAAYGVALGWWHVPGAAPFGGFMLMFGWLSLAIGALADRSSFR